ncbi:hypothetical protein B7494_g3514 [Chlorociboria aeruginascens]|nr:hypothetical protein B7494_g3514 [Chlorociboria aeruginascens]
MTQELRTPRLSLLLDEACHRRGSMNYFIFLNVTGQKIGEIDLFVNFGTWELIYDIDRPENRRKGYGKEAAQELLSDFWGSERRKHVDLVQLEIQPGNIASEMLAKSLGAVRRDIEWWDIHRPLHPRPEDVSYACRNTATLSANTQKMMPYRHRELEIMSQRIETPQLCLQQKFFGNAAQEYYQDHLDLTITLIATHQRIGRLCLSKSEPEIWTLGYYLQPEFRHKGYGEQAAKAALDFFLGL